MVKTEEIVNEILIMADSGCDLKTTLFAVLGRYKIEESSHEIVCGNDNYDLLKKFIAMKKFEGRSEKTLEQYARENTRFILHCGKDLKEVTKNDIMAYLAYLQVERKISMTTVCNCKRYISAFLNWLDEEGYIKKSPAKSIHDIKCPKSERKAYTNVEIEKMRSVINNTRDKALFELLLSTGCRVSEVVNMEKTDIDWHEMSISVLGKGAKERIVYYEDVTELYLKAYLDTRDDDNPALFVSKDKNKSRLTKAGIETIIRDIGNKVGVKAYPHKFRRTFATRAIKNKMPISTLAKLMGHDKIETTMLYCDISKSRIKNDYMQYVG